MAFRYGSIDLPPRLPGVEQTVLSEEFFRIGLKEDEATHFYWPSVQKCNKNFTELRDSDSIPVFYRAP